MDVNEPYKSEVLKVYPNASVGENPSSTDRWFIYSGQGGGYQVSDHCPAHFMAWKSAAERIAAGRIIDLTPTDWTKTPEPVEPCGELMITVPARELELQLRTLQAELKFHVGMLPTAVESIKAASMPATVSMLETMRLQHIEVLQQSIDGLLRFIPTPAYGASCDHRGARATSEGRAAPSDTQLR